MRPLREVLTWLVLIGQALYVALVWSSLPAGLPSHFGFDGLPNRYAPRAILWELVGVATLMVVGIGIVQRFPRVFNLPKPVGHPDRPRLEAIARDMLLWMRLEVACLFAYLVWSIIQVGLKKSSGLGNGIIPVTFAVVALTVGYFIWRMRSSQPQV